jgi:CRISPR-associated protein Csd1
VDRYFSLASTNPSVAFPKIEQLGQKHMQKLRRKNPGARVRIERDLQQLHSIIAEQCGARFPGPMSLEEQGRFAIGFHHQKAQSMQAAVDNKEKKRRRSEEGEDHSND